MIRRVIQIDEETCDGCGLCVGTCHEGAIGMVNGKARLLRDDYCDGLGDCLPACPAGAISFIEREAAAYDEAAARASKCEDRAGSCPGSRAAALRQEERASIAPRAASELRQWPVQIKLTPISAPYFGGAHLLIAADCAAYARGSFHADFMKNRVTLVGCPKLDNVDYTEKLREIIARNELKSVTVVRMEVPCCGGLEIAAKRALRESGKFIPWRVATLSTDGRILED